MESRTTLRALAVTCLPALLAPVPAWALGSRIPNQDPAAIARGNAFVATADNPAALYYNPAGITLREGHHLQAGSLFYLNIYADHDTPGGQRTENKTDLIPIPHFHYAFAPKGKPYAFGLGVYAPFGLGMQWPDDAPFRTSGLEARLTYVTIFPAVAWKPHRTLSLAIGPTLNYSKAKLRQAVGVLDSDSFGFRGDDTDFGFSAGALWQPHPQWSFGATYRGATSLNYRGTASTTPSPPLPPPVRTSARFDFPQVLAGGISYRPTTNWNIEVNVDWTDWNTLDRAVIQGVAAIPLHWRSSFFYELGVTRQLGGGYFASAGYFFSEASTPTKDYTPLVPDTDLHVGSLGMGRKGRKWDWAIAAQIIGGPFREVRDATAPAVNGRYRLFTPTVSFSLARHF